MTFAGFALVFAAALCHAGWNFLMKRLGGGLELIWLFSAVSAVLYLPLAVWVFWSAPGGLSATQWAFIAGSTALHLTYFAVLQQGYRVGDLSVVYPTARATGPALTALVAVLAFGETVTMQAGAGIALIIFGVLMLSGVVGRRVALSPASLGFGLGIGVLIAAYTLWDSHAVAVLVIPPLLLDYVPSLARTGLLAPLAWKRRRLVARHWRQGWPSVVGIAVLAPLAYILVLYALTFTPVTYVAPVRELSVLFTVLLGTLVLKEAEPGRRLFWAGVMVAGVILLATG
ncbi:MAG: DMT family transporter [Rhizobiaceae bacterium]|jgi:drug/metabolite transporter (DMT)-like permease|nr:DMT family transporter [Rhizobiaceae bacterium]